jgi:hypothetical protein
VAARGRSFSPIWKATRSVTFEDTMLREPRRCLALLLGCLASLACSDIPIRQILSAASANGQDNSTFAKSFRSYQYSRPYKALVLARGDSNWAWGWASGDATMREALTNAFEHCEHSRTNMRIQEACRLYAVDDEVVIDYTDEARVQLLSRFASVDPKSVP